MINDVYRVIQVVLNKNNYGVLTPDRFNSLAKDAQLKIYYELPSDIMRVKNRRSRSGLMDALKPLENALDIFVDRRTIQREALQASPNGFSDYFVLPDDFYYLKSVWFKNNTRVEEIDKVYGRYVLDNSLTTPTVQYPLHERRGSRVFVFPDSIGIDTSGSSNVATSDVSIYYQRKPIDPKWTFILDPNGKSIFNPADTSHQDFELPEYFFDRIVIEIAAFSGVHLREQEVQQFAQQEQADNLQKKNLN